MTSPIQLTVNGVQHQIDAPPDTTLLEVLRNDLGLTGTKYACGEMRCAACTVLSGDTIIRSCVTPVGDVAGQKLTTIEGLAEGDKLHPLQQAFIDADAMQCGYCTAGMIMSAKALLAKTPNPSEDQIKEHMNRNVCRCCVYPRIVKAIQTAGAKMRGEE